MRPQSHPGLSLVEVLVAMFVMALGLIALLTLFPLGAMQIGQALKDDRTAQTANLADGWVRAYWRDAVAPLAGKPNDPPGDPFLVALDNPNVLLATPGTVAGQVNYTAPTVGAGALALLPATVTGLNTTAGTNGFVTPAAEDPALVGVQVASNTGATSAVTPSARVGTSASYPVLLDPLGFQARSGATAVGYERFWVGRAGAPGALGAVYGSANLPLLLPRRNAATTPTPNAAYATCALTDDLTYQANGGAGQDTGNALNRQGRYTWAALVQRTDNSRPDRADLTVLVFDGRPPFLAVAGDEVVLTNSTTAGGPRFHEIAADGRSAVLNVPTRGADQPQLVRRGGWVAVARLDTAAAGVRRLTFHRVTGLTTSDDTTVQQYAGGPNVAVTPVAVDLDPPVTTPPGSVDNRQVYLLAGLSEVFPRAMLEP